MNSVFLVLTLIMIEKYDYDFFFGKVFACGEGSNGRLGLGHSSNANTPTQITALAQHVVQKIAGTNIFGAIKNCY